MQISTNYYVPNFKMNSKQQNASNPHFKAEINAELGQKFVCSAIAGTAQGTMVMAKQKNNNSYSQVIVPDDIMQSLREKAINSGIKKSESVPYDYASSWDYNDTEYSTGEKTTTTYNDGTIETQFSAGANTIKYPNGGFEINHERYNVYYNPDEKLIIKPNDSNLYEYQIEIDSKELKNANIKPETLIASSDEQAIDYEQLYAMRNMFKQSCNVIVDNAFTKLYNWSALLEKDSAFANEQELKQMVEELQEKLPAIKNKVYNYPINSFAKDVKNIRKQMEFIEHRVSEITKRDSADIIKEINVPYENINEDDRLVLSGLADINSLLQNNPEIFKNRAGFWLDFNKLKDRLIQEFNNNGNLSAINGEIQGDIAKQKSDIETLINALK